MQKHVSTILLVVVLSLIALGLVMLSSTGAKLATGGASDAIYEHVRRQALWLALGGVVFVAAMRVDYHVIARYAWVGVGVAMALMLACFVPGIGRTIKGATRWIQVLGWSAQPSELAKLALIVFLAWWLA